MKTNWVQRTSPEDALTAWGEGEKEVSKSKKAKVDSIFKKGKGDDLAGFSLKDLGAYVAPRVQSATDKERNKRASDTSAFKGAGKGGYRDKSRDACFICGKTGHWANECRLAQRKGGKGKGKGGKGQKGKGKGKGGKEKERENKAISQAPY